MAKWPYNTAAWRKLRAVKLAQSPLCEDCEEGGRTTLATVVDHKIAISQGGAAFPTLNDLASLCASHHSIKTARGPEAGAAKARGVRGGCTADGTPLADSHPWNGGDGKWSRKVIERRMPSDLRPSAIPLTIVTGPPGSGKSTYIRERAGENDLIICLDRLMQEASGLPEHQTSARYLARALDRRNAMLKSLATDASHSAAWFIVSAPVPREREVWAKRLGGKLVVLPTPAHECIRRINADPTREGNRARMIDAVLAWWRANRHLERKISQGCKRETALEVEQIVSSPYG